MLKKWRMYLLLILPWMSLFKFGKSSFIRYLPTIVFSDLIIALIASFPGNLNGGK
ncbi:hypothetical protein V7266_22970 [Neobacillus drentensis]|uniref:hypothetical protein n=1 Tax=Neobacillus drentensis TaxID=220684 RepID=UPI0030005ADC